MNMAQSMIGTVYHVILLLVLVKGEVPGRVNSWYFRPNAGGIIEIVTAGKCYQNKM